MGIVLLWAMWAHKYMAIFFKLPRIPHRGVFKVLELCDLDKTWSA